MVRSSQRLYPTLLIRPLLHWLSGHRVAARFSKSRVQSLRVAYFCDEAVPYPGQPELVSPYRSHAATASDSIRLSREGSSGELSVAVLLQPAIAVTHVKKAMFVFIPST